MELTDEYLEMDSPGARADSRGSRRCPWRQMVQ